MISAAIRVHGPSRRSGSPGAARTLRSVHDSFEQAFRGFDRDRYPVWRDWIAGAAAHPCRAGVIERMRHAGILDLPGAQDGW